jgi:hypothetical protein
MVGFPPNPFLDPARFDPHSSPSVFAILLIVLAVALVVWWVRRETK